MLVGRRVYSSTALWDKRASKALEGRRNTMQLATKRTPIDMADGTIMYKVHEHGSVGGNRVG